MTTFTVPVNLGIKANSAEEAREIAMSLMEWFVETANDDEGIMFCDVAAQSDVYAQIDHQPGDTQ